MRARAAALVAIMIVGGCSSPPPGPATDDGHPVETATTTPTTSLLPTLPAVAVWRPGPGEVRPEVKTKAVDVLTAAGTWTRAGDGTAAAIARRARTAGATQSAASTLGTLLAADTTHATVQIRYPQYGGLTSDAASVMAITEQVTVGGDQHRTRERTLDVRLTLEQKQWVVSAVTGAASRPAQRALSPAEKQLLSHPGVRLPADAAADVRAGLVDAQLVRMLNQLGRAHTLEVTVLRTGHPRNVFGTRRVSNHAVGRGVDIWAVDGDPVASPDTPRPRLAQVMTAAAALGATEVGGPFDINGSRGGFFTNQVHRDHIHLGINPGHEPAKP